MPTYSNSGGTATTGNTIWVNWIDSASTSASDNDVWGFWVSGTTGSTVTYHDDSYYAPNVSPETEEQRQARLERDRQRQEELETAKLKREAAAKKAKELLRESLDKEQREQFDKTEWFFVISQSGKRYRVRHGWAGNIDEVNQDDMIVANYCIHPQKRIPIEDSMLTQKLMLEIDEKRFVKIANRMRYSSPRPLAV